MQTLSVQKLEELFRHCNAKYFDNALPMPTLKLSRAKTRLGQMACKRTSRSKLAPWSSKKPRFYDFSISISTYYNLSDDELEDIMTHEMIHYSIAYSGLTDTSAHGTIFCGMMDTINRRYGRHISITSHTKRQPRVEPKRQMRLVLLLELTDGRHFLTAVDRHYAGDIEERLRCLREYRAHKWIETNDPSVATLPQVRSLRGKIITKTEYDAWLKRMS